jgi:glycyl-radical enzyme activating protein
MTGKQETSLTGTIFDIQRAGMYDGPGVRTVVFLKGCPLRCLWCHNPESQKMAKQIAFRPDSCVLCGECAKICNHGAHLLEGDAHQYRREECVLCEECIDGCAFEALQVSGRLVTPEEVLDEVVRDRIYYEQSGGGMTLTGGEPMLQLRFTLALLQGAKDQGLHTCIETCGFAPPEAYRQILPLVDLFLFDYKATDPQVHKMLTGADNRRINENLRLLADNGARLWLRCPMIAAVNDSPEHLAAIAALEREYPQIDRVQIMPYHNIGNDKYNRYGMANPLPAIPTTDESTKQRWIDSLRASGSTKAEIG